MAARSPVANVLILALVLLIGLAGALFWQGSGLWDTGETGPSTEGTSTDPGAETGTLKGEPGAKPVASEKADRETIQPQAGGTGTKPKVLLTGRLVRSDGTPGAGLALRFGSMRGLPRRLVGRANLANTTAVETDAEGRFRLMVQASAMSFLALTDADVVFKDGNGIGRGMRVTVGKESKKLGDIPILQAARVSGRVVDSSGPVAGVTVTSDRGGGAMLALTLGEGNKTDADGRFQLHGLRPGEHQMATRSPEHLPQQHKVDLDEGQHLEDVLIQVKPGGFILGTVVDDLRKPVADAEVVASRTQRIGVEIKITGFSPGESTRTDATGRFRLANLDTKKATLRVTKSGLGTQMARDVVVGTTDVVVEMKRLGAIEGVLMDEHNRPVQGSAVFASAARGGRMIRIADILPFSAQGTVTKDDGSFKIQNVEPGRVRVTARGDSHLPARKRVQVRPGETTTGVVLTATAGTTLEVTVQDAAGQPVAGAEVTVSKRNDGVARLMLPGGRRRQPGQRRQMRMEFRAIRRDDNDNGPMRVLGGGGTLGRGKTDARGKATIGGLPGGEALVAATHQELALVRPQDLVLPERGKTNTLLNMRRGGFLQVSAVDAAGQPVAHAKFKVTGPATDEDEPQSRSETCDADGNARVGPLAAGEYSAVLLGESRPHTRGGMSIMLAGMEPDLHDSKVRLRVREGDTAEIVLRKPVLTTVKGTVRDRSGPVKGAEVALTMEGEFRLPLGNGLEARTDKDGRFEITGVPSGKYTLTWGRRTAIVPSEDEIQLQRDQAELVRHLVIPGAVVKLMAWDQEDAEPVEGAEVTLSRIGAAPALGQQQPRRQRMQLRMISITDRGSGPQRLDMSAGDRSANTDEDGVVVIKDVPPGKYELEIKHRRHATHQEDIEIVGDQTLDLGTKKLTPGGAVRGSVLFEDSDQNQPRLQMARVELTTLDGKDTETTVSTDGRFRFSGLAAGKYKVRAMALALGGDPNAPWGPAETVEVKPGRTARTKLKLPK